MKLLVGSAAALGTLAVYSSLLSEPEPSVAPVSPVVRDLAEVQYEGVLRVALPPGPTSWSLEGGDPRGFELDLLSRFARSNGLLLQVRALTSADDACDWLVEGQVDLVGQRDASVVMCDHSVVRIEQAPFGDRASTLAVRPSSTELATAIEGWLEGHDRLRRIVSSRYFRNATHTASKATVSGYEPLFRDGAEDLGWDWRLIAAQAYQESRWRAGAVSSAGAQGLMQLMPSTAAMVGVTELDDPSESMRGAVAYLNRLEARWRGRVAESDLRAFVLASYNAGPGHVEDAVRLAEAYGGDARRWTDVRRWLLRKSHAEWAADPVVRHGLGDGAQVVGYVDSILNRYEHYRQLLPS